MRSRSNTCNQLISCLLLSYPLGSLYVRIPSNPPGLKHLFNLAVSFFYLVPMLNCFTAMLQLLGSTIATYYIAKHNRSDYMPWIVFACVISWLVRAYTE
jgi:lysophospholipid acyltransferase